MTVAQRIHDFVSEQKPAAICNRCIASAVDLTNSGAHPSQITGALGTTCEFKHYRGKCGLCGKSRKVISRV